MLKLTSVEECEESTKPLKNISVFMIENKNIIGVFICLISSIRRTKQETNFGPETINHLSIFRLYDRNVFNENFSSIEQMNLYLSIARNSQGHRVYH